MRLRKASPGFVVYVCCAAACAAADLSAPQEYEGKPLAEVRYEPELQPVSRADLSRLVTLKAGTPIQLSEIRETIKRLYSTGRYASIEAETEPAPDGLRLVFRTTDQWFVG